MTPIWIASARSCGELEFHSLLERFGVGVSGPAAPGDIEEVDYRVLTEIEEVREAVASARSAGGVAVHTVTDSPEPMRATLVGISLSWSEGSAVYLPLRHEAPPASLLEDRPEAAKNLPALADPPMSPLVELLNDRGVTKVGHNLKHHLLVLRGAGVELGGVDFDTMIASYVLDPGRRQDTLEVLSTEFPGSHTHCVHGCHGKREEAASHLSGHAQRCRDPRLRGKRPSP